MDYAKNPPYSLQPPTHFQFLRQEVFDELEYEYPIDSFSTRLPRGANLLRSKAPLVRILSDVVLGLIDYANDQNAEYDGIYFTVSTEPVSTGHSQRIVARNWHLDGRLSRPQPLLLSASTSLPTEYLSLQPGAEETEGLHQTILEDVDEFNFSQRSIQNALDTQQVYIATPKPLEATINTARIHRSTPNTSNKLVDRVWFGILLRSED